MNTTEKNWSNPFPWNGQVETAPFLQAQDASERLLAADRIQREINSACHRRQCRPEQLLEFREPWYDEAGRAHLYPAPQAPPNICLHNNSSLCQGCTNYCVHKICQEFVLSLSGEPHVNSRPCLDGELLEMTDKRLYELVWKLANRVATEQLNRSIQHSFDAGREVGLVQGYLLARQDLQNGGQQ